MKLISFQIELIYFNSKWDGSIVYAKNSVLTTQYIINCRRTGRTGQTVGKYTFLFYDGKCSFLIDFFFFFKNDIRPSS